MAKINRSLAIIIGIDKYIHIPKLKNAVADAQEMANVLENNYGYNVVRLFNEAATKEKFDQLLANLENKTIQFDDHSIQVEKSDRLLFYFAGHGFDEEAEDSEEDKPAGYFMPQNADSNDNQTWLAMQRLYEAFTNLDCHHLLMILDCCFAGRISWVGKGRNAARPRKLYQQSYDRFIKYPTQQIITSAAHDEKAQDSFRFGKRGEKNGHSPFAHLLLKVLERKSEGEEDKFLEAILEDKVITVHELFTYLQNELGKVAEGQTPALSQPRKYDEKTGKYVLLKGEYIFPLLSFNAKDLEILKLDENTNPYKGLASFEKEDKELFFGRKRLIEEPKEGLVAKVSNHPLTIVLGLSGSGKSSLVKAGLIPALKLEEETNQEQWYILPPIRPGEVPINALARAILTIKNVNLVDELTQVKFLDNILNSKTEKEQESKWSDQEKEKFNLIVEAWKCEIPVTKLLLILDNFEQLKKRCNYSEKQQLKTFNNKISNNLKLLIKSLKNNPQSLTAIVYQWSQNNQNSKLLLTIDQSEELITLCKNEEEREGFLRLLAEALTSSELSPNLRIVMTLRSDFEPQLRDAIKENYWQNAWQEGRFFVTPMNREELQQVIEEPAAQKALFFESPKLVNNLIDEVIQMPGALPLLSFTLSKLYLKYLKAEENKERNDRTITEANYQEIGGVARSLTQTADKIYEDLVKENPVYEQTIRNIALRMVAFSRGELARRQVSLSELQYSEREEDKRVKKVRKCFLEARLTLEALDDNGNKYVEPAHDALVRGWAKLREWIEEAEKTQESLALQQRLTLSNAVFECDKNKNAENWEDYLWNSNPYLPLLENVLKSPDNNWLNQLETKFVKSSIRKREEEDINEKKQTINLFSRASQAFFASNQYLEALIEAVKGGKKLQQLRDKLQQLQEKAILEENEAVIRQEIDVVKNQVVIALEQVVYEIRERNRLEGHTGPVESVCFSPDGQTIASAAWDNTVKLWSRDGREINTLHQDFKTPEGYSTMVDSVGFSPNSEMIAACGGNTVKLWNRGNGQCITTLIEHSQNINCVCFNPDGNKLVTASSDNTVKLWNLDLSNIEEQIPIIFNGHTGNIGVTCVCFSPNGQTIASGSYDNTVKLWNLDGTTRATLTDDSTIYDISFSPDGKKLVTASSDKTVKLWNLDLSNIEEQTPIIFNGHTGEVNSVSFSPDNQTIASASSDNTVKLWNLDGKEIITLTGHSGKVLSVNFSPDGQTIGSSSYDSTVKLWNCYSQERPSLAQRISDGGDTEITKLSFSPDGNMIAGAGKKSVKIWNLNSQEIKHFIQQESGVTSVSFSPDSKAIAFGCFDNQVKVYQLEDQTFISLSGHSSGVRSVSFSPNNQIIASGSDDKTVKLWSRNGQILKTLKGHTGGVWSVSFSPDGQIIASGSDGSDKTVKLWSCDGQYLETLSGHTGTVNSICFSPDGQMIASAASDNTVKLWNLDAQAIKTLRGHDYQVFWVSFSPDGQMIASADWDGIVKLWSCNGQLLKTLKKRRDKYSWFYSICFSPDGQTIASGTSDGVLLWNFNLDDLVKRSCNWVCDYLNNNPNVEESDRSLCDGIPSPEAANIGV